MENIISKIHKNIETITWLDYDNPKRHKKIKETYSLFDILLENDSKAVHASQAGWYVGLPIYGGDLYCHFQNIVDSLPPEEVNF